MLFKLLKEFLGEDSRKRSESASELPIIIVGRICKRLLTIAFKALMDEAIE